MEIRETIQANIEEEAAVFAALADPTRLKLLKMLSRQSEPDALCVNALAALLGVTQSAVSQHLRVLRAVGLVKRQRRGYHIHYYINPEALKRCQGFLSSALEMPENCSEEPCKDYCPSDKVT